MGDVGWKNVIGEYSQKFRSVSTTPHESFNQAKRTRIFAPEVNQARANLEGEAYPASVPEIPNTKISLKTLPRCKGGFSHRPQQNVRSGKERFCIFQQNKCPVMSSQTISTGSIFGFENENL